MTEIDLDATPCVCHEDVVACGDVTPWEHFHEDGVVVHDEAAHNERLIFDTPIDCASSGFKHKRHRYDEALKARYFEAAWLIVRTADIDEELRMRVPPEFAHMLVGTTLPFATAYPSVRLVCTGGPND